MGPHRALWGPTRAGGAQGGLGKPPRAPGGDARNLWVTFGAPLRANHFQNSDFGSGNLWVTSGAPLRANHFQKSDFRGPRALEAAGRRPTSPVRQQAVPVNRRVWRREGDWQTSNRTSTAPHRTRLSLRVPTEALCSFHTEAMREPRSHVGFRGALCWGQPNGILANAMLSGLGPRGAVGAHEPPWVPGAQQTGTF